MLVVTEGEKTEVQYLQGLAQYLRATGASVKSVQPKGVGRDPLKVLQAAVDIDRRDPEGFDEVWVVVDVDDHKTLAAALTEAGKVSVPVVVSNPCFEIWLLWHYQDCSAYRTHDQLAARLARLGHDGKHVPATFPYGAMDAAVGRARRAPIAHTVRGPNPSSSMPDLISALQRRS